LANDTSDITIMRTAILFDLRVSCLEGSQRRFLVRVLNDPISIAQIGAAKTGIGG